MKGGEKKVFDSLHSVKETAAFLSVSPDTVRQEIKRGRLKCLVYGQGFKVRRSEIDRFINALDREQNGGTMWDSGME